MVWGSFVDGEVFGYPLEGGGGIGIDLRQQIGALDLVLGPGPLDVEGGDPQVAVVLQGQGDQLLQLLVDKELLPGDVGHRFLLRLGGFRLVGRAAGPGCRNRRGRLLVFRGHGGAAAKEE